MKLSHFALAATLVLALGANTVRAADLTWTNAVSSDWNNATNWTPHQVPTAADHVIINSGSVTIPVGGTFAIMDWMGGSISGSLSVATNGVLHISGSAEKDLYCPLTNSSMVSWSGTGVLRVLNYPGGNYFGAIYNQAGGLFDIQSDELLGNYTGTGVSATRVPCAN